MPVKSLTQWLGHLCSNLPAATPRHLQADSRKLVAGDVFLALPGVNQHGEQYIEMALSKGAVLVLTDRGQFSDPRIKVLPDLMQRLPALAADFYGQPQQQLKLAGITGTNGKSSTAIFINQLVQQLNMQGGVIGTLGYGDYQHFTELPNTTPHYTDIQHILAEFASRNADVVAMEVSSHALAQQRVNGLHFDVAVFTNLTRDHLDYHGTMQQYGEAKALLFTAALSDIAVINVSDPFGQQLAANAVLPVWAYGQSSDCCQFSQYLGYRQVTANTEGYHCILDSHLGEFRLDLPLLGEFNIQNVLAAICSLQALGYPLAALLTAAGSLQAVPGRMETFRFQQHATVVVDYAHTPDALEQALKALRLHCDGKLWCVFGCGGDRDKGKRPLMGAIAQRYADHVVVTSDNPRSEDILQICNDIAAGMDSSGTAWQTEPDRQAAIRLALSSAAPQDIILLAGKGHETVQIIGREQRLYDERAFVNKLTQELAS